MFEGSVKSSDRINIFRDEKYVVVAPLTEEASMKYGADSHWCTSASGSGAWCEESRPNNENSTVGLIILIRRNYKMTPRNEKNSDLYYYLFRKEENGEATKRERNRLESLREDDDYLNMSKLTITFSINSNGYGEVWAANNIHLDWIYSLYDLVGYGIDDYVIDEVSNYISQVRKYKKFKLDKALVENKEYDDCYFHSTPNDLVEKILTEGLRGRKPSFGRIHDEERVKDEESEEDAPPNKERIYLSYSSWDVMKFKNGYTILAISDEAISDLNVYSDSQWDGIYVTSKGDEDEVIIEPKYIKIYDKVV